VAVTAISGADWESSLPAILALSTLAIAAFALYESSFLCVNALLDLEIAITQVNVSAERRQLKRRAPQARLLEVLADVRFQRLYSVLQALRNPLAHGRHLVITHHTPGMVEHAGYLEIRPGGDMAGPAQLAVALSQDQSKSLTSLLEDRGEKPSRWGLTADGGTLVDPWKLADQLYRACLEEWLRVIEALGDDSGTEVSLEHYPLSILNYPDVEDRALMAGLADWPAYRRLVGLDKKPFVPW
jgi:hypothetical protein